MVPKLLRKGVRKNLNRKVYKYIGIGQKWELNIERSNTDIMYQRGSFIPGGQGDKVPRKMTAPRHQHGLPFQRMKAVSYYQGHVSVEAVKVVRVSDSGRPEFEIQLHYLVAVYPCTVTSLSLVSKSKKRRGIMSNS